jgi:hypothetical protein
VPAIGLAGLVAATILVIRKFSVLTGTSSGVVNALPWLIAAAPAPSVPTEPADGVVPDPTR